MMMSVSLSSGRMKDLVRHKHADGSAGRVDLVGHELGAQPTSGSAVVFESDDSHGQFDQPRVGVMG